MKETMREITKHTPGPWECSGGYVQSATKSKPSGAPLCIADPFVDESFMSDHEADANARLIAAAPELLEVCKAMLPIFEAFTQDELSVTTVDEAIALLPAVRAAIHEATKAEHAKAEGEA